MLENEPSEKIGIKLAPFNPAGSDVVEIAISLLNLVDNDIVYDLGCGDGRLLITACQKNKSIKGIGIEYDKEIYQKACDSVFMNKLSNQIQIIYDNVLNVNFSDATVIFIYLVPEGMRQLKHLLVDALDRGVRIVTYVFAIPDLQPTDIKLYKSSTKIYLYKKDLIT